MGAWCPPRDRARRCIARDQKYRPGFVGREWLKWRPVGDGLIHHHKLLLLMTLI